MVKRFSISMRQHTYDRYIVPDKNRSEQIEHLIIIGAETMVKNEESKERRILELEDENKHLRNDTISLNKKINTLNSQIQKLQVEKKDKQKWTRVA